MDTASDINANLAVAKQLLQAGDYSAAEKQLMAMASGSPDDAELLYMLAVCRRYLHKYPSALETLDRLKQLPLMYSAEGWRATHAGFNSEGQPDLSIRDPFWEFYDGRYGRVVIGHTPRPTVERHPSIVLVDTGAGELDDLVCGLRRDDAAGAVEVLVLGAAGFRTRQDRFEGLGILGGCVVVDQCAELDSGARLAVDIDGCKASGREEEQAAGEEVGAFHRWLQLSTNW